MDFHLSCACHGFVQHSRIPLSLEFLLIIGVCYTGLAEFFHFFFAGTIDGVYQCII